MLLERLEVTKNEYANEEAITDSATGQAYVELFAQQTFDRAERTLRANKVTRYGRRLPRQLYYVVLTWRIQDNRRHVRCRRHLLRPAQRVRPT
jgi:hypothetical protein